MYDSCSYNCYYYYYYFYNYDYFYIEKNVSHCN